MLPGSAFKERRLGQPSISRLDGLEAVSPWATPALHQFQLWRGVRRPGIRFVIGCDDLIRVCA